MNIYLAGPMRGYEKFNFPAFDQYTAELRAMGHMVVSPAELDRDAGFDENDPDALASLKLSDALKRDCEAICEMDAIALMPGWRHSSGVNAELTLARTLGLIILDATTGERMKPNVMVCGYARHGKDTVAELMEEHLGLTFISSSRIACELFIFNALRAEFGYQSIDECYADRHRTQAMRDRWHALICAYNLHDAARLSREIFGRHHIYCGIRSSREFFAAKKEKLFDFSVWVDAQDRKPPESLSSCSMRPEFCDLIIDNNRDLPHLRRSFANAVPKFMFCEGI